MKRNNIYYASFPFGWTGGHIVVTAKNKFAAMGLIRAHLSNTPNPTGSDKEVDVTKIEIKQIPISKPGIHHFHNGDY